MALSAVGSTNTQPGRPN